MNETLRVSVDHLLEGVQVIDRQWRYVYLNATAASHGQRAVEELLGRTMMECYPGIEHTELFRTLQRVMDTGRAENMRNEFTYAPGESRWFELLIDPVPEGFCVLSLDITERRQIELELHHAQRMEALGELAGGIAHDFNNQLTAILGFTELLLEEQHDTRAQRDLNEIREAVRRSASLTRQLLAFSRRQALMVEPTDLNAVVDRMAPFLQRVLGASVICELRLHAQPAMILGDACQLENVLTNLAANARDAMPKGGHLTIATSVMELTKEDAQQHATMTPGRYAVLSVSDTGIGMDEQTKARAFEPFFTTKGVGEGTGLGLAMVYGIVKQMKGFVWLYSEVGRGTTLRMYFPTTSESPRPKREPASVPEHRRHTTVLVIEDDARVRDFVTRALVSGGFTVFGAADGEEARRQLQQMAAPPDVVVADIVLPGSSGPDLIRQLGLTAAKVLLMSGYSSQQIGSAGADELRLIAKPFTSRDLLRAIDEIRGS